MITLTLTLTIKAETQEEITEVYCDLVDFFNDSQSTAKVTIDDLDPAKLVQS